MDKTKIQQSMISLRQYCSDEGNSEISKVVSIIVKYVNNYPKDWDQGLVQLKDVFYSYVEKIYSKTTETLSNLYGNDFPKFDINQIQDLCFSEDGLFIDDRIEKWWNEAEALLKTESVDPKELKISLMNKYKVILDTESTHIVTQIEKSKRPNNASMIIIEGCNCPACGEYAEGENPGFPPFHPNCTGYWYYDITDNIDDIEDLDLESEE